MKKKTFSQILKDNTTPRITYGPYQIYWFSLESFGDGDDTFDVNIRKNHYSNRGELESQRRLYRFVVQLLPNDQVLIGKSITYTTYDDILLKHAYRIGRSLKSRILDEYLFRTVYDFDLFMNEIVKEFNTIVHRINNY